VTLRRHPYPYPSRARHTKCSFRQLRQVRVDALSGAVQTSRVEPPLSIEFLKDNNLITPKHTCDANMRRSLEVLSGVALLVFPLLISGQHGQAMDRWAALSQLESGDNDSVRGTAGEVSRYQVRPEIWDRYAASNMNWLVPADALRVAQKIMKERCAEFERAFGRQPTNFEFYVLWNAPACIGEPAKAVRERARRFCNLVSRTEP
jgi:hypothetical protein